MVGKKEKPVLADKKTVADKLGKGYFLSRAIIEIVGKPKKHIEETMEGFVVKISKDTTYSLVEAKVEKGEKVESSEDLYSVFAEVEFLAKDVETLMNFVVDYMPASIEVMEPGKVSVQASFLSNLLTELVGKIHMFDMAYKKLKSQNDFMGKSLGIMIQNSILILLNLGAMNVEKISKSIGIDEAQAKIFIDKLVTDKKVLEKDGIYSLIKR